MCRTIGKTVMFAAGDQMITGILTDTEHGSSKVAVMNKKGEVIEITTSEIPSKYQNQISPKIHDYWEKHPNNTTGITTEVEA